ncbi:hypothetical protein [Cellulomonas sp. NS3]|uniref:hypothetical protein n=1 Tax=Cellulomonas sp. NS3 TaxID=2973977 RepID=UPI0021616096|nr:hypothetical protein [Cellulomonas sp. NS3]
MSTDGPTEKIPTTPAGSTTSGRTSPDPADAYGTSPGATTAASPTASTDPLSAFDEPAPAPGGPAAAPVPGAPTGPGTSAAAAAPAPDAPVRRGVRVGTFVWGLVIVAVGIGVFALSAGYTLDVELALIVLLGAAGAAMLVGSLIKGRRGGSR